MAFQLSLESEDEEEDKNQSIEEFGNICIRGIAQNDVYTKQKQFNSSNHPYMSLNDEIKQIEKEQLSIDAYYKILDKTKYSNYAHLISKNNDRFSIELDQDQVEMLYKASQEGIKCGGIPDKFKKEMNDIIEYIKTKLKLKTCEEKKQDMMIVNKDYFVRLDNCSPKDTIYGYGPFNIDSIKFLVSSLCASQRCHIIFKRNTEIKSKIFLWFIEWRKDINIDNEFRCFCYNKKLTAISQYKWMQSIPKWSEKTNYKMLCDIVPKIKSLMDKLYESLDIDQFTLDIHLTFKHDEKLEIEIIELNSFGVQMACGSGLFHWINDFKQLYGFNDDKIEIRIVVK